MNPLARKRPLFGIWNERHDYAIIPTIARATKSTDDVRDGSTNIVRHKYLVDHLYDLGVKKQTCDNFVALMGHRYQGTATFYDTSSDPVMSLKNMI